MEDNKNRTAQNTLRLWGPSWFGWRRSPQSRATFGVTLTPAHRLQRLSGLSVESRKGPAAGLGRWRPRRWRQTPLSRSWQKRKRPRRAEATSDAHGKDPAAAGCQSPRPGHAPHLAGPALLASQRFYLSVGLWKVSPPKTSLDSLIVERRFRASEGTTKKKKKEMEGYVGMCNQSTGHSPRKTVFIRTWWHRACELS